MSTTIYRVLILLPGAMLAPMGDAMLAPMGEKYEKYCIWRRYTFEPDPQSCFFHTSEQFEWWWRCCLVEAESCLTLFVTLWTVACQALLSVGFPSKCTGVGCHFLLQGIFPTQGSNLNLLHWQADSLPLSHLGRPVVETRTSK